VLNFFQSEEALLQILANQRVFTEDAGRKEINLVK